MASCRRGFFPRRTGTAVSRPIRWARHRDASGQASQRGVFLQQRIPSSSSSQCSAPLTAASAGSAAAKNARISASEAKPCPIRASIRRV